VQTELATNQTKPSKLPPLKVIHRFLVSKWAHFCGTHCWLLQGTTKQCCRREVTLGGTHCSSIADVFSSEMGKGGIKKRSVQAEEQQMAGCDYTGSKGSATERSFIFQALCSQDLHAISWMWFALRAISTAVKFRQMNSVVFNKFHKATK